MGSPIPFISQGNRNNVRQSYRHVVISFFRSLIKWSILSGAQHRRASECVRACVCASSVVAKRASLPKCPNCSAETIKHRPSIISDWWIPFQRWIYATLTISRGPPCDKDPWGDPLATGHGKNSRPEVQLLPKRRVRPSTQPRELRSKFTNPSLRWSSHQPRSFHSQKSISIHNSNEQRFGWK